MDDLNHRRRRLVSRRTVTLLRLVGFRFSFPREAWVHRIGGGRFGPAFVEVDNADIPDLPEELRGRLDEQLRSASTMPMAPSDHRPIGIGRSFRRPGDRPLPVRWHDGDEPTTVFVDGQPPRGLDAERDPEPPRDPTGTDDVPRFGP